MEETSCLHLRFIEAEKVSSARTIFKLYPSFHPSCEKAYWKTSISLSACDDYNGMST